jgi:hypothetical protein
MFGGTRTDRDRQFKPDIPQPAPPAADPSLAETLKRVVRRILRTQSCRTHFEAQVLDEARRLLGNPLCEMARDTLECLIVDRLLGRRREGGLEIAAQGAGVVCPATRLRVANSTFRRR